MSEKHYALFMSSLSARSRELFQWIDPFRNDVITRVLYYNTVDRTKFLRLIRRREEAWKSLHVLPFPSSNTGYVWLFAGR